MTASVAIQVLPQAENTDELVRIVDEVIDYIKSTGLNYYVGPFETTIEGDDYDQLLDIVKECQKVAIKAGCPSVSAYVKITYKLIIPKCTDVPADGVQDDSGAGLQIEVYENEVVVRARRFCTSEWLGEYRYPVK